MTKLVGLILLASAGCSPLRPTTHALAESRYPDAVTEVRRLEPRIPRFGARRSARYALYRGLSHLAVGDALPARRWLGRAWSAFEHDPAVLGRADRARLLLAWRSLGYMPAERWGEGVNDE